MMHTILKYLPYVLLFAVATMIVYGWGLWRTMRPVSYTHLDVYKRQLYLL